MPDSIWRRSPTRAGSAHLLAALLCALLCSASGIALAQDAAQTQAPDELAQARDLIARGRAAEAYELLAAREADWAGTPLFDYLLGLAALDSGRHDDAIFTLERVVAVEPDFAGARMELARAYYEAGEYESSRTQFQFLLTQSPPDDTRAVIERYLSAMARRGTGSANFRPFIEMSAGYDSNANGSTGEQTFLGFTLDPENVETSSGFLDVAAGVSHVKSVGAGAAWVTLARLGHRLNPDADFVDHSVGALSTAVSWSGTHVHSSIGLSGYYTLLDGEDHEAGGALELSTGRRLGDRWDVGLTVRGGPVRYRDPLLDVLEVDRYLAALTLARLNVGGRAIRVGLSLVGGIDEEREDGAPYGNRRQGARLSAGWAVSPRASLYVDGGFLRTNYDDDPGFFGADRIDEEWTGLVALEWQGWPAAGWSLGPRVRYVEHVSNVPLYEYDRWEASLALRHSFR